MRVSFPRLTVLASYNYLRDEGQTRDCALGLLGTTDLLIDSGAFSAYAAQRAGATETKNARPIVLDDYCRFLDSGVAEQAWGYIALDVIKDIVGTRRNLKVMLRRGFKPIPVFVYPDRLDRVPEYVAVNERICVAGGVDADEAFARQRYRRVFAASGGKAQIHALGYVRWPDIIELPVASVDSSSWTAGARYATLPHFSPRDGLRTTSAYRIDKHGHRSLRWPEQKVRDQYRLSRAQLRDAETFKGNANLWSLATARAHLDLMTFARKYGKRYFLVFVVSDHTYLLAAVLSNSYGGGVLDYPRAREEVMTLRALGKADGPSAVARMRDLIAANTSVDPFPERAEVK